MDTIPAVSLVKVLSYLTTSEISRAFLVCKKIHLLKNEPFLWKEVFQNSANPSLRDGLRSTAIDDDLPSYLYEASRQLEAINKLERVCWSRLKYSDAAQGPRLEKMEAHTMTLLLGCFAVIVGGWGFSSDNRIDIIDCSGIQHNNLLTLNTFTQRSPRFRYGFSTLEYKGRLLIYGGCRGGGYSHDCNDCYFVDLKFTMRDTGETGAERSYFTNTQCDFAREHINNQNIGVTSSACSSNVDNNDTNVACCWDAHSAYIKAAARENNIRQVVAQYSGNLTTTSSTSDEAYVPATRGAHETII